jgi:CHASE2 domain-containing sensor protein/GGDEF domain-containing protein
MPVSKTTLLKKTLPGRWRAVLRIGVPVLLLVLGARHLGWFERWSLQAFDWSTRFYASSEPSRHVTAIGISDEDLKLFANPRGKETMLKVLEALKPTQPKAIFFTEGLNPAGEPFLKEFVDSLLQLKHGYALTTNTLSEGQTLSELPEPIQRMYREQRLFLGVSFSDYDAIVRRFLLGRMDGDQYFPSLLVRTTKAYFDDDPNKLAQAADGTLTINGVHYGKIGQRFGEYQIAVNDNVSDTLLIAPKHWGGVDSYSFGDVFAGKVPLQHLKNRVVFVGTHTTSLTALLNMTPGSTWNSIKDFSPPQRSALMTDHLISAVLGETPVIKVLPNWLNIIWISVWTLLAVYLMAPFDAPRIWFWRASALASVMLAISLFAFRYGYWLSAVPAFLGIAASSAETIRKALTNESSLRDFVKVTQSVLDRLPEPVFVKDDHGRIRLVNEALCRLLAAEPKELIGAPLVSVWPEFAALQSSGESELTDRFGRQFKAQIELSSLAPRMADEKLVFGMIRAMEPLQARSLEPLETFEKRFALCQARAKRLGEKTWLISIRIDDLADVDEVLGHATAENYHQQISKRLHSAFPTLESITTLSNDQFLIVENVQTLHSSARELLQGAFSWPITINDERVEAELSCFELLVAGTTTLASALAELQQQRDQRMPKQLPIAA